MEIRPAASDPDSGGLIRVQGLSEETYPTAIYAREV
jgi:hypothetical protein